MTKVNNESIEIANYITKYLNEYIKYAKSTSECTLKSYKDSLRLYLGYLETKGINLTNLSYECFNTQNIENWLVYLKDVRNNTNQTINLRLTSLKVFLEYLGKQDISLLHIHTEACTISKRKTQKIKFKGISKNAIQTLFNCIDQTSKDGRKDLTMFILMYNTGARLNEILSLKLKDVILNVKEPYISIVGKGNKLRCLYLLPKTVEHLEKYINENHENCNENEYLFYSKIKGKQNKLSEQSVEKQLRKWACIANKKCLEIPLNLHPHQLRHSAATHWLDDGMNIIQISYLLGHEQLQTTMVYLEITIAQKAKALEIIDDTKNEKSWISKNNSLTELCK